MSRRDRGHEGPEFTKPEISARARSIYAAYVAELLKRDPHSRPATWEKLSTVSRQLWVQDVRSMMYGGVPRNPEPWVNELIISLREGPA